MPFAAFTRREYRYPRDEAVGQIKTNFLINKFNLAMIILLIIGALILLSLPNGMSHRYDHYDHYRPPQTIIQTRGDDDWHYRRYRQESSNAFVSTIVFAAILIALMYYFSDSPTSSGYTSTTPYSYNR